MDVERILIEEDAAWRALHETLHRIPPERLEEPTVTPEGWSPRDVTFHVAAWCAEAAMSLQRMKAGTFDAAEDPSREQIERMNADWFAASKQMDLPTVRAELDASRAAMRLALGELPEVTEDAWSWFDESGPRHYADHAGELDRWLAGG
jgi:DinB superfamily